MSESQPLRCFVEATNVSWVSEVLILKANYISCCSLSLERPVLYLSVEVSVETQWLQVLFYTSIK